MKKFNNGSIVALIALSCAFFLVDTVFAASPLPVNLLTSGNFVILSGTPNITDAGNTSVITGNVGLSPATGAGIGLNCTQVTGTIYAVDAVGPAPCSISNAGLLTIAKNDLTTAYGDAAGRAIDATVATELGGTTKFPGVYDSVSTTFAITAGAGTLTLDGQGNPNAVFIFKMGFAGTGLTVGPGSVISLIGGAQARNVFWVLDTATINTTAIFKGNILALNSITVANGANIDGRLLARNGNITLINDTVTIPSTLNVIKVVSGGSAVPSDFTIHVKSGAVDVSGSPQVGTSTPGTPYSLSVGAYIVSENVNASYTPSFSGDCDASGNVSLTAGQNLTCTVTNTYIPPVPAPVPVVSGGGGSLPSPHIAILKVPSQTSFSAGSNSVTYNYTIWNMSGYSPIIDIVLKDDKCSNVNFVSGDTNNNGKLEMSETWKYSCTMIISNTITNIATVTGYSDDGYHQITTATATATVVVGIISQVATSTIQQVANVATSTVVTYTNYPTFPNAGIDPNEKSNLINILLLIVGGLVFIALAIKIKRNHTV